MILDYGCVRQFSAARVDAFGGLRDAVQRDDQDAVRHAMQALGARDPGDGERYATIRVLLRSFFSPTLVDRVQPIPLTSETGLAQLVADKRALANLNVPGELLFLFRIRFGLHAVLGRIGAEANWHQFERSWSDAGRQGGISVLAAARRRILRGTGRRLMTCIGCSLNSGPVLSVP